MYEKHKRSVGYSALKILYLHGCTGSSPVPKYRSGAVELTIGKISIGFSLYTNDPKGEESTVTIPGYSAKWGENKAIGKDKIRKGEWDSGIVYDSPLWVGYNTGYGVSRVGVSHWRIQDFIQNGIHQGPFKGANQNYYNKYSDNVNYIYLYNGAYNPYTLYAK